MEFTQLPQLKDDFKSLTHWLEKHGLTEEAGRYDIHKGRSNPFSEMPDWQEQVAIATGEHRSAVVRRKKNEKEAIQRHYEKEPIKHVSEEHLWHAQNNPKSMIRELSWEKLPADALAFYRPFHFTPNDQWGIYLLAGKIMRHHDRLYDQSARLQVWGYETLMHLLIFEIFNHEFFHHLVESSVTYLEVFSASVGKPYPIYLDYKKRQHIEGIDHPHHPLEEALANAYAYNALSFVSRIKAGYKTANIKVFQAAIEKGWQLDPPGYRDAGFYIKGRYAAGGACLIEQILNKPGIADFAPFAAIAKHLMPNGHTALFAKPDIPTYLVGSPREIDRFNELVPALNETYTQLFWPHNTARFDSFIQEQKKREKLEKGKHK